VLSINSTASNVRQVMCLYVYTCVYVCISHTNTHMPTALCAHVRVRDTLRVSDSIHA